MKPWSIYPVLIVVMLCVGNLFASDVSADFNSANKLYARGKFAEAASAYNSILETGVQSPALLFNAGNAEFKAGHLGKAIAAYRQASLLAPRDAELRANLAFVRNQVRGATARESWWDNLFGSLTLNEGTILTVIFFWLTLLLLATRQIRPTLAPRLRGLTRLAVILTVCSGAVLGLQAANHFNNSVAVVTSPEAIARSGPFEDAQNAFTAHDGAELAVLAHHDDWVQVADASGKIGWLNTQQVEVMPGA